MTQILLRIQIQRNLIINFKLNVIRKIKKKFDWKNVSLQQSFLANACHRVSTGVRLSTNNRNSYLPARNDVYLNNPTVKLHEVQISIWSRIKFKTRIENSWRSIFWPRSSCSSCNRFVMNYVKLWETLLFYIPWLVSHFRPLRFFF